MTRLAVNGVFYNITLGGNLAGYPILLLHGFTGDNSTWYDLHDVFSEYCLISVEMLGHGQSDSPAESDRYRLEQVSADLAALVNLLNIEQTAVLGYSMGGRIALHFALTHPTKVCALILESASPGLAAESDRADRRQEDSELADFIEREGIPAFVDRWENLPLWESQRNLPPEFQTALRQQRLQNNPLGLANSLRGAGTGVQPSLWERLRALRLPTLLMTGELDNKFREIAIEMSRQLPNATSQVMRAVGHAAHLENPTDFGRRVLNFLEGRDIAGNSNWGWREVTALPCLLLAGPPATGKTGLGEWLAQSFNVPFFSKDVIKEQLFDKLGWGDRETSARYGVASWAILYDIMRAQLIANKPFVVESTFQNNRDSEKLTALQQDYSYFLVQIQCVTNGQVLYERFMQRANSENRHPGHVETIENEWLKEDLLRGRYEPLAVEGALLEVDTTDFEAVDYENMQSLIQLLIDPPGTIPF